jgi:hypothetical protein
MAPDITEDLEPYLLSPLFIIHVSSSMKKVFLKDGTPFFSGNDLAVTCARH